MRLLISLLLAAVASAQTLATGGHSHNDYRRRLPLHDALKARMASIEADVHLVKGKLLVAHDAFEVDPRRDLATLYLDPLAKQVKAMKGSVHGDGAELLLLVDLKTEAVPTWRALEKLLGRYEALVSTVRDGKLTKRALRVVVSGNRPVAEMKAASFRRTALDGRPADLDGKAPTHLIPLVSDSWRSHFRWRGKGRMPEKELAKLKALAKKARSQGRWFRLWAAPDRVSAWKVQADAGVTLLNTDQPRELQRWLRLRSSTKR